jgi:DNA-binding Xre family transcriptional regulator
MMDVAVRICLELDCQLSDIAEIIPDESSAIKTDQKISN